MRIDPIQLENKHRLIIDYRHHAKRLMPYYDYLPFDNNEHRVNDLHNRTFQRTQLADVLIDMNKQWDAPSPTMENINRLKEKDSVVVIGGQQAGLLTGPLYTFNKIISIIQYAKKQEEKLQIPVIPVFWVAGEDHDFAEINHIFLPNNKLIKKMTIPQQVYGKYTVSDIDIDQGQAKGWIESVFKQLEETEYTKDLYTLVNNCLEKSETYVDFFARLIYELFPETGIVLMDSSDHRIRELEGEYFCQLIEKQPLIAQHVYETKQALRAMGYDLSIDVSENDGHLFYHLDGERILLVKNEEDQWIGKQEEVIFSTEELLAIAKQNPSLLSNNVITRPLMQEFLFPTLAFIGGDGEISYWSVLKQAFHVMGLKMPPVIPRLSFTYVNQRTYKLLAKYHLKPEEVMQYGVEPFKANWLATKQEPPIEEVVDHLKEVIDEAHEPLRNIANELRADLGALAKKNLAYIYREIDFLKMRMLDSIEQKYAQEINEFDLINHTLLPQGSLQERVWNPIYLINENGCHFIEKLMTMECSFEQEHYLVFI